MNESWVITVSWRDIFDLLILMGLLLNLLFCVCDLRDTHKLRKRVDELEKEGK